MPDCLTPRVHIKKNNSSYLLKTGQLLHCFTVPILGKYTWKYDAGISRTGRNLYKSYNGKEIYTVYIYSLYLAP